MKELQNKDKWSNSSYLPS